jgi:hypothetical protein
MPLPRTLPGIIGFMIFVAFLVGEVAFTDTNSHISDLNTNLETSINSTVNSDNIFTGVLNIGGTGIAFVQFVLGYLAVFTGYSGIAGLPTEFFIFFSLVIVTVIVALIKLIRGVAEYYK